MREGGGAAVGFGWELEAWWAVKGVAASFLHYGRETRASYGLEEWRGGCCRKGSLGKMDSDKEGVTKVAMKRAGGM